MFVMGKFNLVVINKKMKIIKKSNLFTDLNLKTKLGLIIMNAIFVFIANTGFSQTPELFEEKILINNMAAPWGFTFINSDEVLFTEKQGKVYHFTISTETLTEISGVPAVSQNGQGGLLDIALHPNFSNNNFVYLTYAVAATGGQTTALGRGTLVGNQLQNFTELFRALPIRNSGVHFGSRIVFDRDNFLYMSVGDRGVQDSAQSKSNHFGKVLRFNDDGTVPASNPLVGIPNTKPEIYCWGNRNIQGMAMNPATGEIYAHEHGPKGGDELNLIKPNTNYGWPAVTFGVNYDGTPISSDTTLPGMELPLTYWVPSIAPSGMTFLRNGQPNNEADILIGALVGTHIHWLKMKDYKRVSSTRSMNGYARFRDIRQAPDGKVYAMTESPNRFVLLRSSVPVFTSIEDERIELEEKSMLYPNPSVKESTLSFYVSNNQFVSVRIYNSNGVLIKELTSQFFSEGKHSLVIESDKLPQGFYQIEINKGDSRTFLKFIKM
jgi:aldose sugar dehydrogenase